MAEEPGNHTLRLLREMRSEIEASRDENKRLHAGTRAELAETRAELAETRAELRAEIAETKAELRTEIAGAKTELRAEIAKLDSRVRLVLDAVVKTGDAVSTMAAVQEEHSAALRALMKQTGLLKA